MPVAANRKSDIPKAFEPVSRLGPARWELFRRPVGKPAALRLTLLLEPERVDPISDRAFAAYQLPTSKSARQSARKDYGRRTVVDLGFEAVVGEASRAIREEGLAVIARIDVRDHSWRELRHDLRHYVLLARTDDWVVIYCSAVCGRA